jgi:uncharacterized protein
MPRAAASRLDGIREGAEGLVAVKASVTAPPVAGKANAALLKLLAKAWRVPKSSLSVVAGMTDRNKTILVAGDAASLMKRLEIWESTVHE